MSRIKSRIDRFLNDFAIADHPDINDEQRDKLMRSHFYYLHEDVSRGGFFVPMFILTNSRAIKDTHEFLKETGWA